ncbi:putative LPS assembly protein LptD [Hoylesella saccharolytica]|uniref:putative LPS assembly protein LptD n=1 Tax=Hoylesella saccharolytica TaxID=633701 RepID=UPI0028D10777|nr:putative LPS assembly protein LptD [Hoylesella saccharolytica]
MRRKSVITLLLFAVVFVMAGTHIPLSQRKERARGEARRMAEQITADSLAGVANDTTRMDSLQKAIYRHNRMIDDSIRLDSLNRQKKNTIEAPVVYSGNDSLVYDARSKTAYLYGTAKVKYENMDLTADRVHMNLDSNLVHATGTADSTEKTGLRGMPVFTMGSDKYESDTMAFNFKTKRGLIKDVKTQQQEGYLSSKRAKRNEKGEIFLEHARYTTCDKDCPDFYISLSRAKLRPGKDVVTGPAYLVVADVPLPFAIPYAFFPFTKSYSSGLIMPTYGDESERGFYLRDGGYYFAMGDKWDLKLLGEIYTKGSWGVSVASNYRKRYRYNGSFLFSYQDTKTGDEGLPDFSRQTSFKLQWSHRQDTKASPFSTFSASVNFASSSYESNNMTSLYNPQTRTQTTRTSSVSWSTTFSSIGMTLSSTANLSQNMRDSSIALTLPDLNISISRFQPFKRRQAVGKERWYEKIALSYTGQLSNSINTKENKLLRSSLVKDWRNGMQHSIPINGNFTMFNYITMTPAFSFTDRMYTNKVMRSWDTSRQVERTDTTYGFHNIYNWNLSLSANTTLYGFYVPSRKLFGDKIIAIRHVVKPQVSFSYAPDFGAARYGYYATYQKTDAHGNISQVEYSPYSTGMFGVPGRGKTGSISFDIANNLEMKVRTGNDSTKKISLIEDLGASMSYNMAAEKRPWSDLNMRLSLKWWKNYTFSINAVFATYAYELDANNRPIIGTHTEWSKGRFGRFQGMSQNISYTLTPEKIKKLFGGGKDETDNKRQRNKNEEEGRDTDIESNVDDTMINGQHGASRKKDDGKVQTDDDGYMLFSIPWSLSFSYGITMRESQDVNKFNYSTMRYPYEFAQTLNFSGNIRISDGWNISFSSGYDFNAHKLSLTTASLQRDLHCFNMSCSVVLAPYTSYNFTFRCNASTLTDALKYDKRSGSGNAVQWY